MNRFFASLYCALLGLFFSGCSSDETASSTTTSPEPSQAQQIINQAVEAHGSLPLYEASEVEFDFRDYHYKSIRRGGQFTYERIFMDSIGQKVHDILTNEGLIRTVNGQSVSLSAKDSAAYANSVNSVLYFALLPYFLNDPAVNKDYLGETTVKGEPYDKIKVTFQQEDGGKDYEDEFVYWFHKDRHTMDYLAYNYQTEGGGARFREAYNVRTVNGLRFADFYNYKPEEKRMDVENFDRLFEQDSLELLSEIKLEGVEVRVLEK